MYTFGRNIFKKDKRIAITSAIVAMFVRFVSFKIALIVIANAKVITKKNQILMTIFHLYFIRIKIRAKARINENMRDMKFGVGSSSGV